MEDEVGKGWWDGRLLGEFRQVLETLQEDDPRLARIGVKPSLALAP